MKAFLISIAWLLAFHPTGALDRSSSAGESGRAGGREMVGAAEWVVHDVALSGVDQGTLSASLSEEEESSDDDPQFGWTSREFRPGSRAQGAFAAHARPSSGDLLLASHPTPLRC
jgi:hypothetical protein